MAIDIVGHLNEELSEWSAAKKTAMLDDFVSQYGYEAEDEDGNPNPVSKKQFMNSKIVEFIKGTVNAYRKKEAEEAVEWTELDGDLEI